MIIIKLALLTCLFYIAIAVILQVVITLLMYLSKEGFMIGGGIRAWGILFGIVWVISFSAAFYIVHASIRAKLVH